MSDEVLTAVQYQLDRMNTDYDPDEYDKYAGVDDFYDLPPEEQARLEADYEKYKADNDLPF